MKNAKRLTAALGLLVLCSASAADPQAPPGTRIEKDLLGEKAIPADAYYGVQTARALENFQISGVHTNHYPGFFEAWAIVKLAAARANTDVGAMKKEKLALIEKACQAVRDGKYHDQFRTDWYQGGAGTSTNMNANEVLANVALELAGHPKGSYKIVEPHDDLNMSQSTNDSYPTAIKIALILRNEKLVAELEQLAASFRAKGNAYLKIVKMGRTELQDAVPMTVGQEFHAFAASLEGEIQLLRDAEKYLYTVNMGATAIGTGLNAPEGIRGQSAPTTWPRSPASRSCPPRTCWPPPGTSRGSWCIRPRSRASRSSSPRSPPTSSSSPPAPAPGWPRSTCRRCSRAPRSCRARSIRSCPSW